MTRFIAFCAALALALVLTPSPVTAERARDVLAQMNAARTDPQGYAEHLREFRSRFRGRNYTVPCSRTRIVTHEGTAAVDEAIRFLLRQRPISPLAWSDGLARAAAAHVGVQGRNGETGHGEGQGGMRARIERQGTWKKTIGENIGYGPDNARAVVIQLIVDDGVPGRGHRKNIFDPAFAVAGVACGPHPVFGTVCVIDFAGGFSD
ncbi:CAP domain-containing protein [Geobacter sulfurreducens]|uniref:SCP-like extracellular lipoprotein n=1 Tax=Geobacter sulfurreducens (strain ATCC 51573 / DSM 12127 / PCA) TaxID=243231 RepID=Q74DZ6_GEOSL|nr:CAP domain-containing protein [Geobacter sulfurreducens]AAR34544.2 SCP-like extracellular lipoprotein [Geobacter sulfurreducens PCA]ADI84006.2 SCP-like extracellular protein [Geobacter sulfurreducens KN400]AJY70888.1 serine protease [Geobacter sulfurreducens]QVW36392.1 CAP domain-containing protein [Geobacter sulfurreducens]UAC05206.1 CAP domain-containing protein [Geobacter sulfurreducens]